MFVEGAMVEFKREYTDDIKKTIIAFANTMGGDLWIGIADNGDVVGVEDADAVIRQVTNAARDAIKPDVTMFMQGDVAVIEGRHVVHVYIQKGTACPYYLAGKGIRPEGVYVRQGSSTVPATGDAIRKMILETGGERYEAARSLRQDLTFASAEKFFDGEKVKFNPAQKRTLGLIGEDGAYSNLGLLLSDQCVHTIKLAAFEGNNKLVFKDRAEFSGSLLKQLDDIYEYINRSNHTRSEFIGLKRIDMRDYPPDAVREALLNAIVHRDYGYGGSTLVSLFDDRMEFVTLGGLPKGISYSDLMLGVSLPRNTRLADVFYRLHLIEAFGTGIPKIMESYLTHKAQPTIDVSDNAFKITLPNTNIQIDQAIDDKMYSAAEQGILEHLSIHKTVSRKELEEALGLSQSAVIRALKSLIDRKRITKEGQGKSSRYTPVQM